MAPGWPLGGPGGPWVAPLALGLCRLDQRLQALHHCRVSLIEVLGHEPWPPGPVRTSPSCLEYLLVSI